MARGVFAEAIRRWGFSVIPYVERGLRDSDFYVRAEAAAVSDNLEDNAATEILAVRRSGFISRAPDRGGGTRFFSRGGTVALAERHVYRHRGR